LAIVRHGDAPLRHAARRVLFCNGGEGFGGFLIPKGVEHGDGAIELGLNGRVAGGGEFYVAESFRLDRGVFVLERGGRRKRQRCEERCDAC